MKYFYLVISLLSFTCFVAGLVSCYLILNNYVNISLAKTLLFCGINYITAYYLFTNYIKYQYGIYA
jgi:hypothetical protein